MEDYKLHLFPYLDSARLKTLSCGHVIPKENLIVWPLSRSSNGIDFDFTYEKRSLPVVINALGVALLELARAIPDGLVAFFPSYAYLELVISVWKRHQSSKPSIWEQLQKLKPIFEEQKGTTSVDDVLEQYSAAINGKSGGKGALLLSVVGGKMSEGINFSDRLGRGVVIVGLPFPNIQSPEWKAKLEYTEQQTVSRGGSVAEGKTAARALYENACMRAVNQSIGRAIRHQADYAAIVMLDRRYHAQRIQEKLPTWIRKGLVKDAAAKEFAQAVDSIRCFFGAKR
ncbi:MAG: hypothetical protein LQ340_006445 [Diploschistes diacapsis]|nr:MAG: hypothetical protein LQ340_006445 [Diploschistes diacapsis]